MTRKEKAKELVDRFKLSKQLFIGNTDKKAKQCALICVDEAQELLNKPMFQYKESMLWKAEFEYWQEVKQEIEKL